MRYLDMQFAKYHVNTVDELCMAKMQESARRFDLATREINERLEMGVEVEDGDEREE